MTTIQPYLFFNGRCEEAVEFYRARIGARVEMLMRMKDSPEPPPPGSLPPGNGNKIMHGELRIGDSTVMVSDGMGAGTSAFEGFRLALVVDDTAEADRVFGGLADGGQVQMALAPTFFSPRFGMVDDRFGMRWMVVANAAP